MADGDRVEICDVPVNNRTERVDEAFREAYDAGPDFYARVPGRVNLIGEHIDYCGYGVCPMALEQDVLVAAAADSTAGNRLRLRNTDPKYEDFTGPIDDITIVLDGPPLWYQYFLCGVKGILETVAEEQRAALRGFNAVVDGTVPQRAGLSSSSALVSAAALTAAHTWKVSLSKNQLADICARCERYIGTQGGGMDQAIAFLATKDCAKLIDFEPLRSTDVRLPPGAIFVIAHSLTGLNKAATGDFNCRVTECRLAAQIIAKRRGLDWTKVKRLGELQKLLNCDLKRMIQLTEEILHEEPYDKQDVMRELQVDADQLRSTSMAPNAGHLNRFKLRQRALHVFSEALRVRKFYETCRNSAGGEDSLTILGRLMSESHESLKTLYECSHPQLDRIVDLSKGLTFGTRLTGAGWGGCTVSLLSRENVDKYTNFLKENFYRPLGITDGFDSILFRTVPNAGACVYLKQ